VAELDLVRSQATRAWDWLEATVGDVTPEQANWWPPGTANSIGATYFHVVVNTDVEVNRFIFGRPPLIEERWRGDAGQGVPYDADQFDRWLSHVDVDWPAMRAYGRAVHAAFVASLGELTAAHLDVPVDMTRVGLGVWPGRRLLDLHGFEHVYIHGGEIACLKGLQGATGWAESDTFRGAVAPLTRDDG